MRFRVLGSVEVEAAGVVLALPRRRERCLLAVLLLDLGRVVPVERLAELLWDGEPPDRARRIIHAHVSRLRAVLAEGGADQHGVELASAGSGYRIVADPNFVDAHRFCKLVDQATAVADLPARVDRLHRALALWRGPALDNAASDWLRSRLCADLYERRLAATEDFMSGSLALRRGRAVLPALARLVAEHPARERLVALYLRALHQAGRRAEALEAYARTRAHLINELGLDPGPELRYVHRAILRDETPAIGAPSNDWEGPARRDNVSPPALRKSTVPRQLPIDVSGFAGRGADLDRLDALLAGMGDGDAGVTRPAAVIVSAIGGTAGIGKTALAVHWAHRVADRFPDGQLYANLHGFTAGRSPVRPSEVVRAFLEALQVPVHRTPTEPAAQAGLYRSLLAGSRTLVLLDNARDADQVRPLLPGTPGCLVLVTSRNDLAGLVAAEGARPLTLDLLSTMEARELLAHRIGAARVAAEPAAVDAIIERSARLPLALSLVAARAAMHPSFPLSTLAAELPDGVTGGVATAFSYSYRALSAPAARLFRLLGLHPGPDVGSTAAISLADAAQARSLLAELAAAHLVTEHRPHRYTFHDLLRAYAGELARTTDSEADRSAAVRRLLDHYLHAAHAAATVINPYRNRITPGTVGPGVRVVPPADRTQALAWFEAEHQVLAAAVEQAADSGFDDHAWRLTSALALFLDRRGYWREWAGVQRIALAAAERLGDRVAQAEAHRALGRVHLRLECFPAANAHLTRGLDLYREVGDEQGQAAIHVTLAQAYGRQGDYPLALEHARQMLRLCRATGDRPGQAAGLNDIGWYQAQMGRYEEAITHCRQALAMQRALDDRYGEAHTWDSLGYAYHHLGRHREAIDCYREALQLLRDPGDRYYEADTLTHLGDVHLSAGDPDTAMELWHQARDIFDDLGHSDAAGVRARLERLAAERGNVV